MNNYFVILAAGKSMRFHKNLAKQFFNYRNKEIIDHSIEKALDSKLFKKIATSSIKYHYFTSKELYPYRHFGGNKISDFIEYLNKTCFAGIVAKEFHYAVYPKRSFYKKHLDTFQNDDKRTISIAFYLNESWDISYGGELKIYLKNQIFYNL